MDEKLALYRQHKCKQAVKTKISPFLRLSTIFSFKSSDSKNELEQASSSSDYSSQNFDTFELLNFKKILIFIFWLVFYIYFIYVEFGAVYFCISLLIYIYYNTRTGKKSKNEISAYSVFNKNCEKIIGTFSAEEVEKQLRTGIY